MKAKTSKKAKIVTLSSIVILLCFTIALSAIGIFFSKRKQNPTPVENVNPSEWNTEQWNTDKWNGDSSEDNFLSGEQFANRGDKAFTINSADSYVWFVNLTQNETEAAKYNFFKDYTIYLNTNIDLQNKPTEQIGKKMPNGESTFQGTFDGAYYTIINAKLLGGLFAYTTNATIKNIGLYNAEIQSNNEYTGGIVDEAIDTTISDVYVRAGKIKGNNVGGIVGKLTLTQNNSITNSFADTTLNGTNNAGLIYEINGTNITEENANNQIINCTIDYCYFTNAEKQIALLKNANLQTLHILANPVLSNFNAWNYKAEYSLKTTWCNYSGNKNFSFNLPILSKFNKTFIYGCYYENVLVKENGEVENLESLSTAFNTMKDGDTAELNLIVEKITVAEPAILTANATLHLESAVNTTLTRGENNTQTLIASGNNSKLEIGGKSNTTITLDGNREYVEANNLKSDAAIIASGEDFTMNNVKVQNNINNTTNYGGGVFVYNVTAGQIIDEETNEPQKLNLSGEITNCESANCGGGLAVVGCASNMGVEISNCKANNGGGLAIVDTIENPSQVNNVFFNYGFDKKINLIATGITITDSTTISSDISGNQADGNGGGVFANATTKEIKVTLNGKVYENTASQGGGICAKSTASATTRDCELFLGRYSAIYSNTAERYGGGIYAGKAEITFSIDSTSRYRPIIGGDTDDKGNTSHGNGGGIYLTDSAFNPNKYGNYKIYSLISHNHSDSAGGGISAVDNSTISVSDELTYNSAGTGGGGIHINNSDAKIQAKISNNTANNDGGGLAIGTDSTVNISGTITNNKAGLDGGGISIMRDSKLTLQYGSRVTYNTASIGGGLSIDSNSIITFIPKSSYDPVLPYQQIYSNYSTSGRCFNTSGFNYDDTYTLYYATNTSGGTSTKTVAVSYLDSPSLYAEFKLPSVGSYEYYGWSTSSSSAETIDLSDENSGTKNATYTRYALYSLNTGTRTSTFTAFTVKFYYGNGEKDYVSKAATQTNKYINVPKIHNYQLSFIKDATTGGTLESSKMNYLSPPSYNTVPHPSNLDSSFALYGWNKSKTAKPSSNVSAYSDYSFTPDSTEYYAVWKAENYSIEGGYRSIYFHESLTKQTEIKQTTGTSYPVLYANYLGDIDFPLSSSGSAEFLIEVPEVSADEDYQFCGWVSDSTKNSWNFEGTIYQPGEMINPSATDYYSTWLLETEASDTDWQDYDTVNINYNWNGGTGYVESDSMQIQRRIVTTRKIEYLNYAKTSNYSTIFGGSETTTYTGSIVLPNAASGDLEGYNLLQWHLNSVVGKVYALGATYKITSDLVEEITFYAEWEAKTYTITKSADNGIFNVNSTALYNEDLDISWADSGQSGWIYSFVSLKIYGQGSSDVLITSYEGENYSKDGLVSFNMSQFGTYYDTIKIELKLTKQPETYIIVVKFYANGVPASSSQNLNENLNKNLASLSENGSAVLCNINDIGKSQVNEKESQINRIFIKCSQINYEDILQKRKKVVSNFEHR